MYLSFSPNSFSKKQFYGISVFWPAIWYGNTAKPKQTARAATTFYGTELVRGSWANIYKYVQSFINFQKIYTSHKKTLIRNFNPPVLKVLRLNGRKNWVIVLKGGFKAVEDKSHVESGVCAPLLPQLFPQPKHHMDLVDKLCRVMHRGLHNASLRSVFRNRSPLSSSCCLSALELSQINTQAGLEPAERKGWFWGLASSQHAHGIQSEYNVWAFFPLSKQYRLVVFFVSYAQIAIVWRDGAAAVAFRTTCNLLKL